MAVHEINIRIKDADINTLQSFLKLYPNNETIPDPEWVDPEDGSLQPQIPLYTNLQWVDEKMRRILIRDIQRGAQMLANEVSLVQIDDDAVETF